MHESTLRIAVLLSLLISVPGKAFLQMETEVFRYGDNSVPCYRIPALLATSKGSLLAFSNARNWTGDNCYPENVIRPCKRASCNVHLSSRRSTNGGKTWSPIVYHGLGILGTVVFDKIHSKIIVQFCIGEFNCLENRSTHQIVSIDDGLTFGQPIQIDKYLGDFPGVHPCCGQALQLSSSGRLVFCAVHGLSPKSNVTVYYSDDGGSAYKTSKTAGYQFSKMGECTMAELFNGSIYMNMRPHIDPEKCKCRAFAISHDGGETWDGPHYDRALINGGGCEASVLGAGNGTVFFSNPFSWENDRANMTVQRSEDNAQHWSRKLQINNGPAGYSSMSYLPWDDDYIGLLYETGATGCRESACKIVYLKIPKSLY
eukprot:m.18075 g.18075  ORF g.18075 m.18075 type:complete len:371 (+) comp27591_c0_seq1:72-1184(+)